MEDAFYFAYGSNMSSAQMAARKAEIRDSRPATLSGYRLVFNKLSDSGKTVYANIEPRPGAVTWGVLYRCSPQTLERLDEWEGVKGGHYRRAPVAVQPRGGASQEAVTYIAGERFITKPRKPSAGYLARILDGAREHDLPIDYINTIDRIAHNAA